MDPAETSINLITKFFVDPEDDSKDAPAIPTKPTSKLEIQTAKNAAYAGIDMMARWKVETRVTNLKDETILNSASALWAKEVKRLSNPRRRKKSSM